MTYKQTKLDHNTAQCCATLSFIPVSSLPAGTEILPPDGPSPYERKAALESSVQAHLDAAARADGWDSIYTAMARAGFPGPFHDHGIALAQWADQCWAVVIQVQAEVMAGTRPEPGALDLLALLPKPPAFVVMP